LVALGVWRRYLLLPLQAPSHRRLFTSIRARPGAFMRGKTAGEEREAHMTHTYASPAARTHERQHACEGEGNESCPTNPTPSTCLPLPLIVSTLSRTPSINLYATSTHASMYMAHAARHVPPLIHHLPEKSVLLLHLLHE
jgi:hypothetical protein